MTRLPNDAVVVNTGARGTNDPADLTPGRADGTTREPEQEQDEEAESSNANLHGDPRTEAANGTVNQVAGPSIKDVLEAMKLMGNQMVAMTQMVTPLVNSSVGQTIHTAVPIANGEVREMAEVNEANPTAKVVGKMDYLKLLEHISRLGTKHFSGSTDPIVADEWRSRLVRNFSSTRCPEDYKRDIAVHFLEGDAHNWWLALDKRTNGSILSFEEFEAEFNRKYFPAEAWDRLEAKFLDLVQGRRTVREYEEEFNRLRRFVGRELEDEAVQVRRFIRGLRPELKTHCSIRTFSTVNELVERMALLEANLADEAKLKTKAQSAPTNKTNDRKRKWDQANGGKSSEDRPECSKCGKNHHGDCWKAKGACGRCGSMEHGTRDCPRNKATQGQTGGSGSFACHRCGKRGHFVKDCPQPQEGQGRGSMDSGKSTQGRAATNPRVYELSRDDGTSGSFDSISGKILNLTC